MRILFLTNQMSEPQTIRQFLEDSGETLSMFIDRLTIRVAKAFLPDFIISYNYPYILPSDILEIPVRGAINLHIAYLPWNRGADPNFWSCAENTPKGVTIHWLDSGVDTGDIIAQEKVEFADNDTLRTSYSRLHVQIQKLFKKSWPLIKKGQSTRLRQVGVGTYHFSKDKAKFEHLLSPLGWDTPVAALSKLNLDHYSIHGRKIKNHAPTLIKAEKYKKG